MDKYGGVPMIDLNKKSITCSYNDLKKFARGEIFFNELIGCEGEYFDTSEYNIKYKNNYEITFDDLYNAITNFSDLYIDNVEFFFDWARPLIIPMAEALCLPKLFGYTINEFTYGLCEYADRIIYATEDDIWMHFFSEIFWMDEPEEFTYMDAVEMNALFSDLLCDIDNARYNCGKSILEYRLTKNRKKAFVYSYSRDAYRKEFDDEELCLYRILLEELCEENDVKALEIKALALYGKGSNIYETDWNMSKKYLLKIIEYADGERRAQAAKCLGNMYYYGYLEDGTADYEKAFYYYSIAYFGGADGAACRIGDMLIDENYALGDDEAAYKLYWKAYVSGIIDFHDRHIFCAFADAAYGLGKYYEKKGGGCVFDSFKYYLQAKTAVDIRLKYNYTDELHDEIMRRDIVYRLEKQNKEIEDALMNYDGKKTNMFVLELLVDLFADFVELEDFKVSIKFECNEDVLTIRFIRKYAKKDINWDVMVASKCLPFAKLTDTLVLRVANKPYLIIENGTDLDNLEANEFTTDDDSIIFYMNDDFVIEIKPVEFLFYIEDQI